LEISVELSWISCTSSFWLYWFITNNVSMAMIRRDSMMITSLAFSFTENPFHAFQSVGVDQPAFLAGETGNDMAVPEVWGISP
jgi:hypothetical protein